MLNLKSQSSERWLKQVDENLKTILIDHAHCEQKAASTAMHLMFDYVEHAELRTEMSEIVQEELEHFQMVTDILDARKIRFFKLKPGTYGRKLKELCRRQEPEKAVDRLLVAGLIEARSCERFALLRDHLKESEPELSEFFGSLFESEARHHATYTRLARIFQPDAEIKRRLAELSALEAAIIEEGCELPRVHS